MANRYSIEAVFKAVDKMTGPVSAMQKRIGRFTSSVERGLRSADRAVSSFNRGLMSAGKTILQYGTVAVGALTAGIGLLVREFSKVEDAQARFQPILGSIEKAEEMVAKLNETSATTPFQFENLADAANQLLPVMNGNIDETIRTLRMLGDTAGGSAQRLDSVTRGFTNAMLKGKVDMDSLKMIAEAGVPIFDDLAAVMGMDVGPKFFKMISSGRVTTQQLTKAFEKATGAGGKFYKGMEIASKTTSGMISTLKDNISRAAAEIGGALAPTIKDLIGQATVVAGRVREWAIANREVISERFTYYVNWLIQNFGTIVMWLKRIGIAIAVWITFTTILKAFVLVMTAVNLVMALNPIGLIVLGVLAAVAAFTALVVWIDDVRDGLNSLPGPLKVLLAPLMALINGIKFVKDAFSGGLGYAADQFMAQFSGDSGEESGQTGAQAPAMVSPAQRNAVAMNENRVVETFEAILRDETGRVETTRGGPKSPFRVVQTGAY